MQPSPPARSLSAVLCVLLLSAGDALSATDISVPLGGNIQASIDVAVDGDRVLVPPGVYLQTIDFKGKAISVIGTGGPAVTILKAPAQFVQVVRFHAAEGEGSVLQGFTVRDGYFPNLGTNFGAGISCLSAWAGPIASPTIRDCWVLANRSGWGGGIAGNPVLERCIVAGNGSGGGGGLWGAPQAKDCVFVDNYASEGCGGGAWVQGTGASFERCIFSDNTSHESTCGAGAYVGWSSSSATFTRCLFLFNRTQSIFPWYSGSGIAVGTDDGPAGGSAQLVHCTLRGNTPQGATKFPGTLFAGNVSVLGSVVWQNFNTIPSTDPTVSYAYCDVEGGVPGPGILSVDPAWVNANFGDLHLRASSPCIDAGAPGALDPDGTPADLGAHPFATLYTRDNTLPESLAAPSWPSISQQVGGRQVLTLTVDPSLYGKLYLVLGSLSGTAPGLGIGSIILPLNPDAYFNFTLTHPNNPVLQSSFATVPFCGTPFCPVFPPTFALPPAALSGMAGISGHHAAVVIDPVTAAVVFATNAVPFEIGD